VPFIERIASREIYRNRWLVLREDDIRRPDGSPGIYSVVDKPTYVLVMPYDGRRFRLVEQMIRSGAIADAQSIAAYGLFLLHRR
jgi:8-oxo-dGDP phosphatase